MPRLIDPGHGEAIGLDELVEALETHPFDPSDEDGFADVGPLLARLGRNPDFLADLAIAELEARCAGQAASNGYGAQSFLLKPPAGRYLIRANFWPALGDVAVRASGAAAFLYDMPHDHNFPFLTYGYQGPGYWSDYYERDAAAVTGVPGEPAGLRFVERSRLEQGKLMLYRARRDVHRQLPPDAFSVSLNILGYAPGQPWIDQYRFDLDHGTIVHGLNVTPAEGLLTIAAHLGGDAGLGLARDYARRHPCERMRVTALDALLSVDGTAALPALERAAGDRGRYVAAHARLRLDRIGSDPEELTA
ncbi:transposase [Sphingomonas sp. DT-204]|uniref:transposase n=1 Tax=Sphingomonas sp. DT-204 TaxID=3396166 RepID=UPI003F19903C